MSEPLIPPEKWDACTLPSGFTAADGVAIMAIELGISLAPWQFDFLARVCTDGYPDVPEAPPLKP